MIALRLSTAVRRPSLAGFVRRALVVLGLLPLLAVAAPLAGTVIGNQAAATYSDGSATTRTVTSNLVTTTVQQVGSVSLAANGAKTASPGGQVYYPHTIVNTGNGVDTYALASSGTGGFAFTTVLFYADANGDGVPDNAVPVTTTGQLAPGQTFRFVAAGVVPSSAVAGASLPLTVTATSAFAPAVVSSVVDTTSVTTQAVVAVTQALDVTAGPSPAGPRTITLTYANTGNTTASALTLTETLPAGLTYVAGSARWSGSGTTVLTDADATDSQSGIVYDFGVTAANRMTAVVASVAPGASGTLTFQVNVASGLAAGASSATAATATYAYNDGVATLPAGNTNTVQYLVTSAALVAITGSTIAAASQGQVVSFPGTVTNGGNASDSFDLTVSASTFPAGTTFQFVRADGVSPLTDTNGNGVPDSGPLAPAGSAAFVLRATLPTGASGGPYTATVRATSKLDPTRSATAVDTLTAITANTVDLTNDSSGASAPGYGPGPEALAVSTLALAPGATGRITLVVSNTGSVADSFGLVASTDASFAAAVLPVGWSVTFRDAGGAVVDGTGVLPPGTTRTVYADVTAPAGAPAATTQLWFRVLSATTGASDRLHDAVVVGTVRGLGLTPQRAGQLTAGGTVVYEHVLTNVGNVLEADGTVGTGTVTVADSQAGFTSVVYWDKNNNGVLDAGDPVVTDLAALVGGTNGASTAAGLSPGESVRLLVKVTAPAGAVAGLANVTTLSVTLVGGIGGIAAPAASVVTDASTVVAAQVAIVVTQALDANCDGLADTAFAVAPIVAGALPGSCIRYEVTATNVGPVDVTTVVVSNATPPYTTYSAVVPAAATAGTVTAPSAGATGTVQTALPRLAPGAAVVLRFGVRIDP